MNSKLLWAAVTTIFALSVLKPRSSGVWASYRAMCLQEGWEWVRPLFVLLLGAHVWVVYRCRTRILLAKTRALSSPRSTPSVMVNVRVHPSDRDDRRPLTTWVRFR